MKKQSYVQQDLFILPKTENECLWEALQGLKDSHNTVRKRLFGELKEMKDLLTETRAKNERLLWLLGEKVDEELQEQV